MTREWDAASYDALPLPHVAWGRGVVDRLALTATERVLDAGCGTGRDAALVLERHPDVDLVVLDGSAQMLDAARERLGTRAAYVHADLTAPLPVTRPVDAVMSVACFHWVADHDALFRHLAAVLRPGGRLVSDCGGEGNIAHVDVALQRVLGHDTERPHFAGVEDTRRRLRDAGLEPQAVRLRPDPLALPDPDLMERYLATVVLGAHLTDRPGDEGTAFVREVRRALPEQVLDYVRLEVEAVRV
ncbi:MAG: trans-aconitate methyltransferase [Frankiales bacterium]|nr:trans-aconitate methyltransferase [Frankiales bacterium]